nr:MAG TPA: hypothetical protein [Caudoviricetes sp.]
MYNIIRQKGFRPWSFHKTSFPLETYSFHPTGLLHGRPYQKQSRHHRES